MSVFYPYGLRLRRNRRKTVRAATMPPPSTHTPQARDEVSKYYINQHQMRNASHAFKLSNLRVANNAMHDIDSFASAVILVIVTNWQLL